MKIRLFTIPNLLTLGNLMCGSCAVLLLQEKGPLTAFWLVVAAAVFDFLDGFSARLLKMPSAIGIQLDSLADMVSFGFLPAIVMLYTYSHTTTTWFGWSDGMIAAGYFIPLIITAFSALRLAKFNVDDTQHTEFCGLPTPANALFCTSMAAIISSENLMPAKEAVVLTSIVCAVLLIAPVRMFSLKFHGFGWSGNEIRYLFLLLAVATIILLGKYSVPAIIVMYIVISLVRNMVKWGRKA